MAESSDAPHSAQSAQSASGGAGQGSASVSAPPLAAGAPSRETLAAQMARGIAADGGWWPFDRFMAAALYAPGLGYYSSGATVFGLMPSSGSDFVTAPELSGLFGRALAAQVADGLKATDTDTVVEFGAGSGALAEQLLDALDAQGVAVARYRIVDLSGSLRARQASRLARFAPRIEWLDTWPEAIDGVVIGNEVLDAMPVQLLHFDGERWWERGVAVAGSTGLADGPQGHPGFVWADRPTALRPPFDGPFVPGTVTEVHPQAEAFVRSLAGVMRRGLALFIDYGFPEAEYYHPQRHQGTVMCHRAHRADGDPLADVGEKDITAHVNFTGIALAAQAAGLEVAGYTSQARFLFNCGLLTLLEDADLAGRAMAQKLVNEHEMGELFKVIAFVRGWPDATTALRGFADGDRTHRL